MKESHPPASGANFGWLETHKPHIPFGSAERMFNVEELGIKVPLSETLGSRVVSPLISLWRTHPGYYFLHLSYFPSGDGNTITSLCSMARFITYCTFLREERGSTVLGRMASWWISLGGWGQRSARGLLQGIEWMGCRVEISLTYCQQRAASVSVVIPETWTKARRFSLIGCD